jgi:hypothetical protein
VLKDGFLVASQFYSLTVSARSTISGDVVGSNRVYFQANSAPSSGGVEIVGTAAPQQLQAFQVRAFGWVDVDVPLKYIFSLVDRSSSQEVFLTELSDLPSATVVAPTAGSMLLRVRVFDRLGSMAVADAPVVIAVASPQDIPTLQGVLLSAFNRYAVWGDVRSANTYGVALAASYNSRNELATAARQSIISSLAGIATQRRLLWVNSPAAVSLLQAATQIGDFSLDVLENSTHILESVVAAAQTSAVASSYSVSSSELARFSTSGFLRAASNTAQRLASVSGARGSMRVRLQRVVEAIVQLQARFVAVDELATTIVTETLLAASIVVSSETLAKSGGQITVGGLGIIASNWNSSNTFTVISWGSGVFPSAPNTTSPVVQLLFDGAQVGNVSFGFSSDRPGTCALYDDSTGEWDSKKCQTRQSGQQIVCECSASATETGKPILLSLLFSADQSSPAAPSGGVSESTSSSSGLIAGIIVAVVVVLIVAALVTVYAVPSLRAKFMPFANQQKASMVEDIELESERGSPNAPAGWAVGSKPGLMTD